MELSASQSEMVNSIATNCLSVRLRLMNRKVGAIYDKALRPHGIKASQLNILVAVSVLGRVTSRQLCRMLHMDASTFSRAVMRLKRNRWLIVEPSGEGKVLGIEISKIGLKKIEQIYPDWQRAQVKAVQALGESTFEVIIASGSKHLLGV